jgi:Mg-chelatase subunit ChlD
MTTERPVMSEEERLRRWRLILGGGDADGTGASLDAESLGMDRALTALYDSERKAGLGSSAPSVARWLGDIREFFPSSVVRVMQKDALERLDLRQLLTQPELLSSIEPDVHLVATLLSLKAILPGKARETARQVVRTVVEDVERRLAEPLRQAVRSSLDRAARTRRPRHHEIDWPRTIRANLKHYQAEYRTAIPEQLIGYGRRGSGLRDILLCIDQSGSMAASVVYAGIFGAVLASLRAVRTRVVAFDTAVVDLSDLLSDPVELLFGTQLGGGTDINRALAYCQTQIQVPSETILVLISDLYEGGNQGEMLARVRALMAAGVQVIALLALSDQGAPGYDHQTAAAFAGLGVPAFACTPDLFPELMAAAIQRQDVRTWASARGIGAAR